MKNVKILSIAFLWLTSVECRPINHANNHHDVAHYAVAGYGQKSNSFDHNKAVHKTGSVDANFAIDGFYSNVTGTAIYATQIQQDGKILIAGRNSSADWYVGRLNSDGSVDTTFAASGFYEHSTGNTIYAMQIQQDGKILIAGYGFGGSAGWYVGRLNADGSVDASFALNGYYKDSTGLSIYAMQIQRDGKILIAGYNSGVDWYVGRLNIDGSLDTTFASNGFYSNSTGMAIHAMQIQQDGRIVLAGRTSNNNWYAGRLNADGSVDANFASNGFYENSTGSVINAMQIQQDGKILLAGYDSSNNWYVGRLHADGSLDTNFATNGFYSDSMGRFILTVQTQADGKILIAGDNNSSNWYTGRLNSDGSVDTSFASSGFYENNTGRIIYTMQVQQDGKIVLAGYDKSNNWYVGRLNNDEPVDTSCAASICCDSPTGQACINITLFITVKRALGC